MPTSAIRAEFASSLLLPPPLQRSPCRTGLSGALCLLVIAAGVVKPSPAQATAFPGETIAAERSALAVAFASERLCVWQKRLNLEGWKVSVAVARTLELKAKTLGNVRWDREKKTAAIRFLDPADYHLSFDEALRDIEFTVVHELIHLEMVPVLSDLQRTDANRTEEEHAVNRMAEALLKLDRGR